MAIQFITEVCCDSGFVCRVTQHYYPQHDSGLVMSVIEDSHRHILQVLSETRPRAGRITEQTARERLARFCCEVGTQEELRDIAAAVAE